jgi:opacity protein-like surface antigen
MKKQLGFIIWTCILLLLFTVSHAFGEDGYARRGKTELFALGQTMGGDSVTEAGIKLEIDNTIVGGIGMGYNFFNNLNLNTDVYFGSTDVEALTWFGKAGMDADILGFDLNLDYNIINGPFTPLLTTGIGYIRFEADDDIGETDFSYNIGAGFRYDVNHFFLKAIYRATWTQLEDTDETLLLDGVTLFAGYIF